MRKSPVDEEIEKLVVSVRADTQGFARDVAAMRGELDGPFAGGIERAGRTLENSLLSAIRRGSFGFEDLRRVALSVLSDIASAAIRTGLDSLGGGGGGGIAGSLGSILGSLLGAPGGRRGDRSRQAAPTASAWVGRSCSCRHRAGGSRRAAAVRRRISG